MKSLYFALSLFTILSACTGLSVTPDTQEKEEKIEVTGSLIPRKQPKGLEVISQSGFEKAMDDASRGNGLR